MSAKDDYKLRSVGSGDNVRSVARASRINALQNLTRSQVSGDQYGRSSGSLRSIGPGWVVQRRSGGLHRGASTGTHPWHLSIGSGQTVRVSPGTINGTLPINMFDSFGPIAETGTSYIILQCYSDGVDLTYSALSLSSSPPEFTTHSISSAPLQFQFLIGVVVNLRPFDVADGLLWATATQGVRLTKPGPGPGEPYYDNTYTWVIEQY